MYLDVSRYLKCLSAVFKRSTQVSSDSYFWLLDEKSIWVVPTTPNIQPRLLVWDIGRFLVLASFERLVVWWNGHYIREFSELVLGTVHKCEKYQDNRYKPKLIVERLKWMWLQDSQENEEATEEL